MILAKNKEVCLVGFHVAVVGESWLQSNWIEARECLHLKFSSFCLLTNFA